MAADERPAADELLTAVLGTDFAPTPHERAHQAAALARVLPQVGDIRAQRLTRA